MAKETKPQTEAVTEETPAPKPEPTKTVAAKETKREIELKVGQCIIAPVGKEDEEILTTIRDWNNVYNKGKNQGKFILKEEKKSS